LTSKAAHDLLKLVEQRKARIVKEFRNGEQTLVGIGASGSHIGIVAKQHRYLFEKHLVERGSGDGLFEGCSQTTVPEAV